MTFECFELFLEGFAVEASIGVHPQERARPQRVLIDLRVGIASERLAMTDRLADTFDYDVLRTGIGRLVAGRHFQLQETLAREIVELIAAHRQVEAVEVVTRKPDIFPDARAVGCRLTWRRPS